MTDAIPSTVSKEMSTARYQCAACSKQILDRYLLKAVDKFWHENCLTCAVCKCKLSDVGSSLFLKKDMLLCRTDYVRMFGVKGECSACAKDIPACELVMRAGKNVYHLECFGCQDCHSRFCVGEKFYLDLDNNRILCEEDFKERMLFAQMANYPVGKLNQLKRDVCRKLGGASKFGRPA